MVASGIMAAPFWWGVPTLANKMDPIQVIQKALKSNEGIYTTTVLSPTTNAQEHKTPIATAEF